MSSKGKIPSSKAVEAIVIAVTKAHGKPIQLPADEIQKIVTDFFEEERERLSRKVRAEFAKWAASGVTIPEAIVHDVVVAVRGFDGIARRNKGGRWQQ
jgi:hexokinase